MTSESQPPLNRVRRPERSAVIDLAAIRHNVRHLKSLAAPAQLMAVVKADAYGHGAVPVARAAVEAGADFLGVAHVSEGLELRQAGITAPVVAWLHTVTTDFAAAIHQDIQLGVSGWELEEIAQAAAGMGRTAALHLKVDTGLGRNGYTMADWPAVLRTAVVAVEAGAIDVVGIMTHLGAADDPAAPENDQQLSTFRQAVSMAREAGLNPRLLHAANTPGTFDAQEMDDPAAMLCDLVRVGIGVYGISPFVDRSAHDLGLIPAMTLRTTVSNVKDVPAGQGVSYGFNYRTERPTTLALIPLGYADGVPRIGTGGPVQIQGVTYAEVGRVAMDQMVVDLGAPGLAANSQNGLVGAEAVLFGADENPSVRLWSQAAQTIDYEIVTRISPRVPREYVDTGRDHAPDADADADAAREPVWSLTFHPESAVATQRVAQHLAAHLKPGDLVILSGELGAGKTTFTQGLGAGLGVREGIISPTFVLARQHPNDPAGSNPGGPMLVHVDAYRLATLAEVDDIDLEQTLPSSVTVVEWGHGKVEHLTDSRLEITIDRAVGGKAQHAGVLDAMAAGANLASVVAELQAEPDAEESDADGDEPRRMIIRAFGPRWANAPLTDLTDLSCGRAEPGVQ
ncbi:alanine racemase [Kocuria sp.]|uniref:alanine racemase n=1 Tax=Kocuria sp. TaxID=1871328 RepID=UPI0026E01CE7|nr:alanine racemase [Kocuria sp.]MDO5617342.1 alanine racemase [Kocuria sp.]